MLKTGNRDIDVMPGFVGMWRIPLYPLTGNTEHARIEVGS